jgi:mannose-6-phosphate isomerase-like protein (cupin superfamily)
MTPTGYRPSPRPTFSGPAAIPYASVTRHVWGDPGSGEVADWIYASTDRIHMLVFGLPPGGRFMHSPEFRTVFGADEVIQVLSGTLVIANPETGEVHRVPRGGRVAFGPDTWHHAFAHGSEPLRALEFLAPPPSTGTSGAYARTRPYLEPDRSRYRLDSSGPAAPTIRVVTDDQIVWRRDLDVLMGVIDSTDELTVCTLEINPGESSRHHAHGGDEVLFVVSGAIWVRAWDGDDTHVFELGPNDACYIPHGCEHEYRNYGAETAEAVVGVAPHERP